MTFPLGITSGVGNPADPNYSSIITLLHGDGTDLSTTIVDNGPFARTMSRFGDTSLRTAQKKFGTASIFLDGSGDYMTNDQTEVSMTASQMFTVDGWFWTSDMTNTRYIMCLGNTSSNGRFLVGISTGHLFCKTDSIQTYQNFTGSQWNHFAMVRNSSAVLKGYLNGVEFATLAGTTASTVATNATMTIGATDQTRNTTSTSQWTGYLDDLRYTKGVCRYTANFTPPTQAYPNH